MTSNICYTLTHILKQFGFPHVCIGDTSLEDIVSPVFFLSSPLALYSIRGTYNNDISIDFHIEKPSFAFFFFFASTVPWQRCLPTNHLR